MQIKVFKAGNMKDAMAAMKAELGDDAVILHSKKYKEGGLLGIGSREVVEITAAIEETSLPKKNETIRLKHPTVAPNSLLTRYKTDGTAQAVAEAEQSVEKLNEKISEPQSQPQDDAPKNFEDIFETAKEEDSPPEQLIVQNHQLEIPKPEEKIHLGEFLKKAIEGDHTLSEEVNKLLLAVAEELIRSTGQSFVDSAEEA